EARASVPALAFSAPAGEKVDRHQPNEPDEDELRQQGDVAVVGDRRRTDEICPLPPESERERDDTCRRKQDRAARFLRKGFRDETACAGIDKAEQRLLVRQVVDE